MTGLLVHEWISTHGGSEKVLQAMTDEYPRTDILCLWQDSPEIFPPERVRESALARSRILRRHKALALPLMPLIWQSVDLSPYEWLLISSHAFAHQIAANATAPESVHVYVHTPARYIWSPALDPRRTSKALIPARAALRSLDKRRASRTASFAANSAFIAERILDAWDRPARVIYPPVEVLDLQNGRPWVDAVAGGESAVVDRLPDRFVLGASRFVRYKRVDRAIDVGEQLGLPVVIAGNGEEEGAIQKRASSARVPVSIVRKPSDALLRALMERASLYVFPPVEDFGIMPVEAAALGTPSLVNLLGGARESVERMGSGFAIDFDDGQEVKAVAERLIDSPTDTMMANARYFDRARFISELTDWRRST